MMWLYKLYIVFVVQMCYLKKRVYANTCCKSLHIRPLKGSFTAENKWDNPATPELCWYRKIRSCSAIYSLFFEMQFINLLPHISLSLQACQSAHMPSSAIANCWRCLSSEAKKWVQTIFAITGNVLSLKIFCTVWTFTLLDLYTHTLISLDSCLDWLRSDEDKEVESGKLNDLTSLNRRHWWHFQEPCYFSCICGSKREQTQVFS